jgi:hypothetical protein
MTDDKTDPDARRLRCIGLAAGTMLCLDRAIAAIDVYKGMISRGCPPEWAAFAALMVGRPETLALDAKLRACDAMMAEKLKDRKPIAVLERKMEAKP